MAVDDGATAFAAAARAHLDAHSFRPAWWLPGGHAQTVFGTTMRVAGGLPWQQEHWPTPDGDELSVWIAEGERARPVALLLHGLEGSARSHYVRGLGRRLRARGWTVVAMEYRSCDGRMNRARRMYHGADASDVDLVVRGLLRRFDDRPLYLAGFSLGANLLTRWLGEHGDDVPDQVTAGAAVSPPFDFTVSGPAIDRAAGGFYARHFLRTLVAKAVEKERQFPGCVDIEAVRAARTLKAFDDVATAPLHGFRDAHDYWQSASCGPLLPSVRRPLLLIAAEDDPFNPASTHPRAMVQASPWLLAEFTPRGGHIGFIAGALPGVPRCWAEEQTERFFAFCDAELQSSTRRPSAAAT